MMKKYRRFLSLLLAVLLMLGPIPVPVLSVPLREQMELMGTTADGFEYSVVGDHVEITGYTGTAAQLTIPEKIDGLPVTGIGPDAFYECTEMTGVTIPESVTSIGDYAFFGCSNLDSLVLPKRLSHMGDYAFAYCSGLRSVTIPEGVTSIGASSFWKCFSLSCVTIPGSVAVIENAAFSFCANLESVTICDGVSTIGYAAFAECYGLQSMTIPDSVTNIDSFAFYYCSHLTEAPIPLGTTRIGKYAFGYCLSLPSVTIPGSVEQIEQGAFEECQNLTEVIFCADAPVFGENVFLDVSADVHYPTGNSTWTADVMQNYGGTLTWSAYEHIHQYDVVVTPPTCTEQGYTTHTCSCSRYVDDYTAALGHDYTNGCCTRCGDPDPNCPDSPFSDVPRGAFYYFPVLWAVENEVTSGMTPSTFGPFAYCNRAQVVTFLWRTAGSEEPNGTHNPFTDVPENSWYTKAVLWAVENGITNGLTADSFGPDTICNRAQVVTFLWRACGFNEPVRTDNPFVDVPDDSFFHKAILWALENNVTTGADAQHFNPQGQCMRAQVVTFLYRAEQIAVDCTVTFHGNGGSAPEAVEVERGDTISRPADPVREGYVFSGWFSDEGLETLFLFGHDIVTADLDLYAGWIPESEDALLVAYAASRLAIGYHQGDYAGHVTADVTLPTCVEGADAVAVSWISSSECISADGKISRPEGKDASVYLTAQLRKGDASMEVPFVLRVIHMDDREMDEAETITVSDLEDMNEKDAYFELDVNEISQVISINGRFTDIEIENADDAADAIQGLHEVIGLTDPYEELTLRQIHDSSCKTSYTFTQEYNGCTVYSLGITVTADSLGNACGMSSSVCKSSLLARAPEAPVITAEAAQSAALLHCAGNVEVTSGMTELVYYALNEYEYTPALAYLVYVSGTDESGKYLEEVVFVDSQTGEVIHTNTLVYTSATGSGSNELGDTVSFPVRKKLISEYAMEDSKRGFTMYTCTMNGQEVEKSPVESRDNTWNDPTAVSAYTNVIKTHDWYEAVLGRTGLRNDSGDTKVYVHDPKMQDNSYWSEKNKTLNFCDSSDAGQSITSAGALDVVAHEYTHGVFDFELGVMPLPYENMTGAINEGYADILSNFVDGNWLHGEAVAEKDCIRDASDPDSKNADTRGPDAMSHWAYITPVPNDQADESNDFGGVHINSLLLSHAAYLMCEEYGLNRYTAAYLWYLSMSEGYSGKSTYQTVRQNVLKAARVMKLSQQQIDGIKSAFDQVEIWEESGTLQVSLQHQNGDPLYRAQLCIDHQWTYTNEPVFEISLEPGTHTIELSHPDYSGYSGTVTIEADKVTQLNMTLVSEGDVTAYPCFVSFDTQYPADLCRAPAALEERDVIETVSAGTALASTALYELSLTHYWRRDGDVSHTSSAGTDCTFWYEVTYNGTTCYIHGEDTTAHKTDLRDISIRNVAAPSRLEENSDFCIAGEITTDHTEIRNISVQVTSPDGRTSMSCSDPFRGNRYNLKDSIIDYNLDFRFLDEGRYTYRITGDTVNYYTTDGVTVQTDISTWELYRTDFTVGEVPLTYRVDLRVDGCGTVKYRDQTEAAPGESFFFYAIPDEGYILDLILLDTGDPDYDAVVNGLKEIYELDDNLYEFTMIDHDIILICVFSPL